VKTHRSPFVAAALGSALVLLVVLATACGSASPYAARVNDKTISEDALVGELRSIAANEAYLKQVESQQQVKGTGQGTFDSAFTALALTRQIYYVLIADELKSRNLTVTDADLAAARAAVIDQLSGEPVFAAFSKSYQDDLVRRQAALDVLTVSVNGMESVDKAARAYYAANPNDFATACVSHILVPDEAQANAIRGRLAAGEDFATVAKAESKDTASAEKGGNVGCDITKETGFVPEFLLAAFTQPVGEVGAPVKTEFGYHLIKVDSRTVPPYEQVATQARRKVTEAGQDKVLSVLEEAVQGSKIEINPKYGSFRKTGNSPGVVPPQSNAATTVPTTVPTSGAPAPGPAPSAP
jgi:parvulin-like peptidyl-prolyl isomerase